MSVSTKRKKYLKDWRLKNKAKYDARMEAWRKKNRVSVNAAVRRRYRANPKGTMLINARRRARLEGLPFSIGLADFEIPKVCPVLGIPLRVSVGRQSDGSPSLDKIIPELGYVKGNVTVISLRANRIKNDATLEELESLVTWMRGL